MSIIISGNILYSISLGLIAILLILWILHDDNQEQEEINKEKENMITE